MGLLYLENVYVCKSLYDRWYIFYLQPSECQLFFFIFSNIKEAMFPHLGLKIMKNFSISPQARQSEQLLRLFVQALEFTDNPFSYPL